MAEGMTVKERWLAAIRLQPVDRLPFWPKLDVAYPNAQATPFQKMTPDAIHDWIGSDKHKGIAGCIRHTRTRTSVETTQDNQSRRAVYRTPHGELSLICKFDPRSRSWHPASFPVRSTEDVTLMTEVFEDVGVDLDPAALEKARDQAKEIGQDAVTTNAIGTSPLMDWVEWLAGVENAHLLLMEHPDEVEGLFDAMHRVLLKTTTLLCENSPADLLYLMENTSTTLISPDQYRRHCLRHIQEYARITAEADRNLVLHMCGRLKAILPDLAKIPAQAFEAFTSPPVGNTTLLDGRTVCPDTCLVGGTNAVLWTKTAAEIIAGIQESLDELPHHRGIVVTSAGVMPPMCSPETIKQVGAWVRQYPARNNGDQPAARAGRAASRVCVPKPSPT